MQTSGLRRAHNPHFSIRVFNPHAQSNHQPIPTCYRKHESCKKRAYEQRVREVEQSTWLIHPSCPVPHWLVSQATPISAYSLRSGKWVWRTRTCSQEVDVLCKIADVIIIKWNAIFYVMIRAPAHTHLCTT